MRIEYLYTEDVEGYTVAEMSTALDDNFENKTIIAGSLVMDNDSFRKLIISLKMKFPSYIPKNKLPKDFKCIGFILRTML